MTGATVVRASASGVICSSSTMTVCDSFAGSNSSTTIRCVVGLGSPGLGSAAFSKLQRRTFASKTLTTRWSAGTSIFSSFNSARLIVYTSDGAGANDVFVEEHLLFGLHAGQNFEARRPFGSRGPVDANFGRGADEGQDLGPRRLGVGGRHVARRDQRMDVDLHPRLVNPHLPAADRRLRRLERDRVRPGPLGERLGVLQRERDLLRVVLAALDEQVIA